MTDVVTNTALAYWKLGKDITDLPMYAQVMLIYPAYSNANSGSSRDVATA